MNLWMRSIPMLDFNVHAYVSWTKNWFERPRLHATQNIKTRTLLQPAIKQTHAYFDFSLSQTQ